MHTALELSTATIHLSNLLSHPSFRTSSASDITVFRINPGSHASIAIEDATFASVLGSDLGFRSSDRPTESELLPTTTNPANERRDSISRSGLAHSIVSGNMNAASSARCGSIARIDRLTAHAP
ncbi:hypothetical protein MMC07_008636 [Pseudocyphellaria aurata]|nr:hypothetical protein [Pseudocyphellaria aurata]